MLSSHICKWYIVKGKKLIMKVLLINVTCGSGSTGRICTDLATSLDNAGHEVKIAYGRNSVPNQYEKYSIRIGSNAGIQLHALKARLFDSAGLGSEYGTKSFIKWVEDWNPDVIHLHNIHGYYINYPLLFNYLNSTDIPVIWTLHDCWAITGHCSHFEYYKCEKWKTGCCNCEFKNVYPKSWLLSNSERNYQLKKDLFCNNSNMQVVVPSKWLFNVLKDSFLNIFPISVINNGINIEEFNVSDNSLKINPKLKNKKIILAVASVWTARKGYDDIIKLSKMINHEEYSIAVIGVSNIQKEELERFGIIAIQHTENKEELINWYSNADVFINPTYEDTFPTVNIEALACGTPVVTYRTGGSPEILTSECGKVVDKGNIESLYKAICTINRNPAACRAVAEKYDAKVMIQNYLNLYNDMAFQLYD